MFSVALAVGVAAEQHQLGMVRVVREDGVHLELTEAAGQGDVGGRGDGLVAEHEHLVAHQAPGAARRRCSSSSASLRSISATSAPMFGVIGVRLNDAPAADSGRVGAGAAGMWLLRSWRRLCAIIGDGVMRPVHCSHRSLCSVCMDVELRRLRHLIAVAEHGNFGRAAAACYITQPALSRSIQALEAEVGAPLFDRRRTGVELTDMGRLLLRHASDARGRRPRPRPRGPPGQGPGARRAADRRRAVGRRRARRPGRRSAPRAAPRLQHAGASSRRGASCPRACGPATSTSSVGSLAEIEQLDDFEVLGLSDHDMVVVGRAGHPLTVVAGVTLGDVFGYPLVGPGMDSDAAELLVGLAGAGAGSRGATTGPELLTIECDSSDVLKRMLLDVRRLDVHAPLRRRHRRPRRTTGHRRRRRPRPACPLRRRVAARPDARRSRDERSSTCCRPTTRRAPGRRDRRAVARFGS